jgi:hypothetical protein
MPVDATAPNNFRVPYSELCNARMAALEQRLNTERDHLEVRFRGIEASTSTALTQQNIRFENTNEWRAQLKDQMGTFVTGAVLEAKLENVSARIDANSGRLRDLEKTANNIEGRFYSLGVALIIINIIIGVILKVFV